MPRLLLLRTDPQRRLICSICRKRHLANGVNPESRAGLSRRWVFGHYRGPNGEMQTATERFELRGSGGAVEMREVAPSDPGWIPFNGGSVYCPECTPFMGNYLAFNPRTGESIDP